MYVHYIEFGRREGGWEGGVVGERDRGEKIEQRGENKRGIRLKVEEGGRVE